MKTESEHRLDIIEVGRRIWMRGFVASNDGNISVRLSENEVLCTPTGVSKGFLTPDMLSVVDLNGNQIRGDWKMSSEVKVHLRIYKLRPDVNSVVHAHPPVATGFAVAGLPLDKCILPEIVLFLGSIPLAPYETPSTDALAESIVGPLSQGDAVLMANHGAVTVGSDVYAAYHRMEAMELFAHISLVARQLGGENMLTRDKVAELMAVRERFGIKSPNPGCLSDGSCPVQAQSSQTTGSNGSTVDLVAEVTRRVVAELQKAGVRV